MTEEEKAQVSEETLDTGQLPQPEFSEKPASSTSMLSPDTISALSEALLPVIEDTIERKFKSTTDKRFSKLDKLDKTEGVMKEVLATLKQQGVAIPKELERELQLKDYVDSRIAQVVAPEPDKSMSSQRADVKGEQFNVVEELKSLGLDANTADVISLLQGKYRNPDHFRAEAAKLALKTVAKTKVSETTTPAPTNSVIQKDKMSDDEVERKSAKLKELYRAPTKNADEIKKLEKELENQ